MVLGVLSEPLYVSACTEALSVTPVRPAIEMFVFANRSIHDSPSGPPPDALLMSALISPVLVIEMLSAQTSTQPVELAGFPGRKSWLQWLYGEPGIP